MAIEEGGKAVNSVIDALKAQPISLALVLMNLALLVFLYYQGAIAAKERHHEMDVLTQTREKVVQLLSDCIHDGAQP